MRLGTPDLASGDFEVTSFAYFGEVNATVKLGGSLDLRDVTDDDADRLIRAACAAKEANAAERERIAQPHLYFKAGPRCLRCGKPEDDELHTEPETAGEARCQKPASHGPHLAGTVVDCVIAAHHETSSAVAS